MYIQRQTYKISTFIEIEEETIIIHSLYDSTLYILAIWCLMSMKGQIINFMNKDQPQISESKIQYTIKLSFHLLIYLVWTLVEWSFHVTANNDRKI